MVFLFSSVDATHASGFGRMINDCHRKPNCKVVVEEIEGKPKLCIYTIRNVSRAEELRFDYKDATAFWRKVCINNY